MRFLDAIAPEQHAITLLWGAAMILHRVLQGHLRPWIRRGAFNRVAAGGEVAVRHDVEALRAFSLMYHGLDKGLRSHFTWKARPLNKFCRSSKQRQENLTPENSIKARLVEKKDSLGHIPGSYRNQLGERNRRSNMAGDGETNGIEEVNGSSSYPSTDPAVYDEFQTKWSGLPDTAQEWIARAREVAQVLERDVVDRDRENKSPRAEVALLKHAGLLKLLGPKRFGGGEQPWSVAYAVVREVAKADG
jgi:hypothetical protein